LPWPGPVPGAGRVAASVTQVVAGRVPGAASRAVQPVVRQQHQLHPGGQLGSCWSRGACHGERATGTEPTTVAQAAGPPSRRSARGRSTREVVFNSSAGRTTCRDGPASPPVCWPRPRIAQTSVQQPVGRRSKSRPQHRRIDLGVSGCGALPYAAPRRCPRSTGPKNFVDCVEQSTRPPVGRPGGCGHQVWTVIQWRPRNRLGGEGRVEGGRGGLDSDQPADGLNDIKGERFRGEPSSRVHSGVSTRSRIGPVVADRVGGIRSCPPRARSPCPVATKSQRGAGRRAGARTAARSGRSRPPWLGVIAADR